MSVEFCDLCHEHYCNHCDAGRSCYQCGQDKCDQCDNSECPECDEAVCVECLEEHLEDCADEDEGPEDDCE